MNKILFYFFLKPLSMLPLSVLYFITWPLYAFMAFGIRYRHKVLRKNLSNSFPEKTDKQLLTIERKFYRHFFDQILESVRMISMSDSERLRRFKVTNPEVLTPSFDRGQSIALVIGHYNNWEFTPFMNSQIKHQYVAIYSKLRNPFINEIVKKARSAMGSLLVEKKEVGSFIRKPPKDPFLLLFAADQTPDWRSKLHWTQFLHQKTGVATGPERYAKMLNMAVVFGRIEKAQRGYYEITFELLTDSPKDQKEGHISELHLRALEKQIIEKPEYWLWTHKRWKKKTEKNLELSS
jgi:KDO2-lipid IV(A) lauroyltransferase